MVSDQKKPRNPKQTPNNRIYKRIKNLVALIKFLYAIPVCDTHHIIYTLKS